MLHGTAEERKRRETLCTAKTVGDVDDLSVTVTVGSMELKNLRESICQEFKLTIPGRKVDPEIPTAVHRQQIVDFRPKKFLHKTLFRFTRPVGEGQRAIFIMPVQTMQPENNRNCILHPGKDISQIRNPEGFPVSCAGNQFRKSHNLLRSTQALLQAVYHVCQKKDIVEERKDMC